MKIKNWFSHDSDARNDSKILNLRMRYGAAGYGVFFMLIERLREETNYMSIKDYNAIAFDLRVDAAVVKSVVEDFGLFAFTDDGECFYSESLYGRMEIKDEKSAIRSEAGKKGAKNRWSDSKTMRLPYEDDSKTMRLPYQNDSKTMRLPYQNDGKLSKESKVKKDNEGKKEKDICSLAASDSAEQPEEEPYDYVFERAWKAYPKKRGKNQISEKCKREIAKVGLSAMLLAVERYKQETAGVAEEYLLNGSTFFHGRYKDYLGDDFVPVVRRSKERGRYDTLKEWRNDEE